MSFRVEFTLTQEEIRAALRTFSGPELRRRALVLWVLAGLILVTLLALIALSVPAPSDLVEPGVYVLVAWLVALPVLWVVVPRLVGRKIAPAFLEPTQFWGDEESFSVTRSTFSGSGSWAHFYAWREVPGFFMLAHSPSVVIIVPKSALDAEQAVKLRELLGRVVPQIRV
jgi:hypothetical protein